MVGAGQWTEQGGGFRTLSRHEKLHTPLARACTATAGGVREYAERRYGVAPRRFYVKPASVDMELFTPALSKDPALLAELGLEGKLVCVYAGKLGGIYLDREVFDFFKAASLHWGERFRALMLTNAPDEQVNRLAAESGL